MIHTTDNHNNNGITSNSELNSIEFPKDCAQKFIIPNKNKMQRPRPAFVFILLDIIQKITNKSALINIPNVGPSNHMFNKKG